VLHYKLTNNVKFIGYVDDPSPFVRKADIALMCSRFEAFGRVTIEAMKLGKPVIGAKSGGTTELIRNNFNGFLYTPGNYRELAEKILTLYEHPDLLKEFGENGKKWANEQFTEERFGREIINTLQQVLLINK